MRFRDKDLLVIWFIIGIGILTLFIIIIFAITLFGLPGVGGKDVLPSDIEILPAF